MLQDLESAFADFFPAEVESDDTQSKADHIPTNEYSFDPAQIALARSTIDESHKLCGLCGGIMPTDRTAPGKKGRAYKYCSDRCTRSASDFKKIDRIRTANRLLTKEYSAMAFTTRRDEEMKRLLKQYVLFKIGYYRDDPTYNNRMRVQAEAITNDKLFGSEPTIRYWFMGFLHKDYSDIANSIYDTARLEAFARAVGWVGPEYRPQHQPLIVIGDDAPPSPDSPSHYIQPDVNPVTAPEPAPAPATEPAPKAETLADLTDQQIYSAIITKAASYQTAKPEQWSAWTFQRITGRNLPAGLSHTSGTLFASVDTAIRKSQADYKRNQRQQTSSTATDEAPTSNDPRKIILAMVPAKGGMTTPDGIHMKMERDHGTSREESSRILGNLMSEGLVTRDPCSPTFLIRGKV